MNEQLLEAHTFHRTYHSFSVMLIEIRTETGQYTAYAFWRHPVLLGYCPVLADSSWFLCWYLETDHDQFLTDFVCFLFIIILPFNDAVHPQHQKQCHK